ncbi:hypothetical protein WM40_26580, partial [Robbsia andropogonis]
HRTGQRPLDRLVRLLTQEPGIFDEDGLLTSNIPDDRWHAGIVAIADSNRLAVLEIDAVQMFDKRGHKMLARLLAVTDDIDACLLLLLQRQTQSILFALDQSFAL